VINCASSTESYLAFNTIGEISADALSETERSVEHVGEKEHPEVSASRQHASVAYPFQDSGLVDWDGDHDPELLLNWSSLRSWLCVGIVSGMTCAV
jgi:hypothetical protein